MIPTKQALFGAGLVLAFLVVGLIFAAPLCFTTSCTPAERQTIATQAGSDLGSAGACLARELALGEETEPLVIVAACAGATLQGLAHLAADLLADELYTDAAPDVLELDAQAVAASPALSRRAARRARLRALHAAARALLDAGAAAD